MKNNVFSLLLITTALTIIACDKDEDAAVSSMSWNIEGKKFVAVDITTGITNNVLFIKGWSEHTNEYTPVAVDFGIDPAIEKGEIDLSNYPYPISVQGYHLHPDFLKSGTLTIHEHNIAKKKIKASFNFIAAYASDTIRITDGKFNVYYQ